MLVLEADVKKWKTVTGAFSLNIYQICTFVLNVCQVGTAVVLLSYLVTTYPLNGLSK